MPMLPYRDDLPAIQHVVDNRVFLLGLDELYRAAMMQHEKTELLGCARRVSQELGVAPSTVPVEGYYAEEPELTEYFLLMRALQEVPRERERAVERLDEFQRLLAVTSSPIYGRPQRRMLLPAGRDPLSAALDHENLDPSRWTVEILTPLAARLAGESDDYSLVGLAALAEDPVVLTALRESVVLYAEVALAASAMRRTEFVWLVDPELAARAARFVATFNALVGADLPAPVAANAAHYWGAGRRSDVVGRCVRLGQMPLGPPYYHWAIQAGPEGQLAVHEFWDATIWTTQRYRSRGQMQQEPRHTYVPRWGQHMKE